MKSRFMTCVTTLLIILAGPASADLRSGTITFSGAMTNGSCNMNIVQNPVVLECTDPTSGRAVVTTADMKNARSLKGLPAIINMRWLNSQKSRGIIEVSYL